MPRIWPKYTIKRFVQYQMIASIPTESVFWKQMPLLMDGPTASREIRAVGYDSFIVGIPGNVLPDDVAHFKACGVNAVLPKPLNLPVLELLVEYGLLERPSATSKTAGLVLSGCIFGRL